MGLGLGYGSILRDRRTGGSMVNTFGMCILSREHDASNFLH